MQELYDAACTAPADARAGQHRARGARQPPARRARVTSPIWPRRAAAASALPFPARFAAFPLAARRRARAVAGRRAATASRTRPPLRDAPSRQRRDRAREAAAGHLRRSEDRRVRRRRRRAAGDAVLRRSGCDGDQDRVAPAARFSAHLARRRLGQARQQPLLRLSQPQQAERRTEHEGSARHRAGQAAGRLGRRRDRELRTRRDAEVGSRLRRPVSVSTRTDHDQHLSVGPDRARSAPIPASAARARRWPGSTI